MRLEGKNNMVITQKQSFCSYMCSLPVPCRPITYKYITPYQKCYFFHWNSLGNIYWNLTLF